MNNDGVLVFLPTYNERENIEELCNEIIGLGMKLDILILDDNSPDGTGEIIDRLAVKHPNIKVIHRAGKLGIGSAHQDGIKWAYDHNYEKLITMDSDFTHQPKYIVDLIVNSGGSDVVVGSRYLFKEGLKEWNLLRKMLTLTAHMLTRHLLNIKYDATNAFRLYNLNNIPYDVFKLVNARGYSFFFESLYILNFNGLSIREIPIVMPARTYGSSKMRFADMLQSVQMLLRIYFRSIFCRKEFKITKSVMVETDLAGFTNASQEWDNYWQNRNGIWGVTYGAIAQFYRKFIIKRTLNHFMKKYFRVGDRVLHAGCGSGQVDTDIRNYVSITALDLSLNALDIYKKVNSENDVLIRGNILALPLVNESMDGIYNLGVMEHFDRKEIRLILKEFHRVLKTKGKMVIFWPPKFGLSVLFFRAVSFLSRGYFVKKNVKFYPDEITKIESKKEIEEMFKDAYFDLIEYYFGIRDLFTYCVLVVEKK